VAAVTNSTGTLTSQQRYLPLGGARSIPNSPIIGTDFGYTGQRMLDSGLGGIMDYKARFYSPYINRFLQPDSIIPDLSNPQSWNRYSYVTNRPVNFNDPTGHMLDKGDGAGSPGCKVLGTCPIVYGPPVPQDRTFHTAFQMYPALPSSPGIQPFTDFSTGGNPEYTPMLPYVPGQPYHPINDKPTVINQLSNGFELLNGLGMGILPEYYRRTQPYDQHVYINYTTTQMNEIPVTNLVGINIRNSTYFGTVINYVVVIKAPFAPKIESIISVAPDQAAAVPLPDDVSSAGGFNVTILANNTCPGTCIQRNHPLSIWGALSFVFNP
jgi:RHS repeat-associated protein